MDPSHIDPVQIIALSLGAAWASGINLYATLFMLGFLGATGHIELPAQLQLLTDPLVLIAAALMYCVEFFADKTPGVDTAWDALHSFIRIPAGAVLAAGAVSQVGPAAELAALLVGGSLSAATHATKTGSRILINTSPEPFSNWAASVAEDLAVIGGLWAALHHPWLFLGLLALLVAVMAWALPRLWRGIRQLAVKVASIFSGRRDRAEDGSGSPGATHERDPPGGTGPTGR
jgi:hypothetical protein